MEKYQEIERSIIKKYRKDIWAKFIKSVQEYELIQENVLVAEKTPFYLQSVWKNYKNMESFHLKYTMFVWIQDIIKRIEN